jgi:hypothetical protein
MRYLSAFLIVASPLLTACQQAHAVTNDEMAQCIGVLNFGRGYWVSETPPNYRRAAALMPGILYYSQKLKSAGVADGGDGAGDAFASANVGNPKLLLDTLKECGDQLQKDPEFRNQFDALSRVALRVDPICQQDMSRCAKR